MLMLPPCPFVKLYEDMFRFFAWSTMKSESSQTSNWISTDPEKRNVVRFGCIDSLYTCGMTWLGSLMSFHGNFSPFVASGSVGLCLVLSTEGEISVQDCVLGRAKAAIKAMDNASTHSNTTMNMARVWLQTIWRHLWKSLGS